MDLLRLGAYIRGKEFYSIVDGTFASMIMLLTAVNEGIGAYFVGRLRTKRYLGFSVCQIMSSRKVLSYKDILLKDQKSLIGIDRNVLISLMSLN